MCTGVDQLSQALARLSLPELLELRGLIDDLVEAQQAGDDPGDDDRSEPGESSQADGGRGWIEIRMVNGCGPYAYQRWWAGKRKRSKYLGKVKK